MKTAWDYSDLAQAYLKRPDYSDSAIDELLVTCGAKQGARACDIGAGVAHLTLMLADRGLEVTAIEPNDNMRALGQQRTKQLPNVVAYIENTAEDTGQDDSMFDIVTFGSSFNVTDRQASLTETARILKPGGWFAAMWNHRDLSDPIQAEIEGIISDAIPEYGYGTRREDQTDEINKSGLFGPVEKIEGTILHEQQVDDVVEAWRSHATLHRQAGDGFGAIIDKIENQLRALKAPSIQVPYTTRVWAAKRAA